MTNILYLGAALAGTYGDHGMSLGLTRAREKLLEILAWIGFRTFLHQEQGLFKDSYEALPESLAHDSRSDRPWESYVSFNVLTLNSTCKWLSIWMAPGAQSMCPCFTYGRLLRADSVHALGKMADRSWPQGSRGTHGRGNLRGEADLGLVYDFRQLFVRLYGSGKIVRTIPC